MHHRQRLVRGRVAAMCFLSLMLSPIFARAFAEGSDCPCLANGGQPTQRCACDVQQCYAACVETLCPGFPRCTFECSRRCSCEPNLPLCPSHEDPGPTPTAAPTCAGDCDDDGRTTVDEVLRGVSIVVGSAAVASCRNTDRNGDGRVTVEEVIRAVNAALYSCGPLARPVTTPSPAACGTLIDCEPCATDRSCLFGKVCRDQRCIPD